MNYLYFYFEMKRIIFLVDSLGNGGLEKSLVSLTNELSRLSNHKVVVIAYAPPTDSVQFFSHSVGVKFIRRRPFAQRKAFRRTRYFIDRSIAAAKLFLFTFPGCESLVMYSQTVLFAKLHWLILKKRFIICHHQETIVYPCLGSAFREADYVVVPSSGVADIVSSFYSFKRDRCVVVHPIFGIRKPFASGLHLRSNHNILICGRFAKEKRFDLAVEVADVLRSKGVAFHVFFVGDGPEKSNIKSMIERRGLQSYISITESWVEDPTPFFEKCSLYLCVSAGESYGRVILEAILHGAKVVSTKSSGPLEIDGFFHDICFVEPDPFSVANGILKCLGSSSQSFLPESLDAYFAEPLMRWKEILSA